MSSSYGNGKVDKPLELKSSDSEDNWQTDDEAVSEESFSGSLAKFKNFVTDKSNVGLANKKNNSQSPWCRLTVSLRYGKCSRQFKIKSRKVAKQKKSKKPSEKGKSFFGKQTEIPKKGKRCRLGGKAKAKPPEEDTRDKRDSDEDSVNLYYGRISLGHFQKFKDKSGASTSYQWEEDHKSTFFGKGKKAPKNTSEEMELLELQKWGRTALFSSHKRKPGALYIAEDIKPDKV